MSNVCAPFTFDRKYIPRNASSMNTLPNNV
jgi:hypothetical protein